MKKILMRASLNPLSDLDSAMVISNNMIGNNAGNMLFTHSIMRTLMCEDVQIDTILTYRHVSDRRVERINHEYDCFVIPLANAFRKSFRMELVHLTQFVRRLQIPCIVIGVGVQSRLNEDVQSGFEFDEDVINFVKAILEKSAMLGVRGEITADYMKKLGFREEKDFTVIGCPAMYMHGDQLELKEVKELTPDSLVSVNRKIGIPKKLHRFIMKSSRKFENYMYVPQAIEDLRLLYLGTPIPYDATHEIHPSYPWNVESEVYAGGHEIGFTNVKSWLDFLSGRDFSFGSRIHGNIAAVLAGIPAYIIVSDSRILELAQYHNLQYCSVKEINKNVNIFDVYNKADFSSVKRGHTERFYHFLDFLEANGLQHVYGEERTNLETPFDRMVATKTFAPGVLPYTSIPAGEKAMRHFKYYFYYGSTFVTKGISRI